LYDLLGGLSVIEASSFVASPTAGLYCAQMGAEVIRVDQIGGGPDYRRWPVTDAGDSLYWENLNRAKKSVALDLSRGEGRELLQALVRATGQFITNFPVSGFLSHDLLASGRPDLITVRVMGWADGSPALDYTVNNAVGYPMLTGKGPEPVNHVLPAWDLLTGAYAAFALLAALRRRDATGQGGEVRVPLSDVAIGTVANLGSIAEVVVQGERPRLGNTVYGLFGRDFLTADGVRTMIVVVTPRQWSNLLTALGIADAVRTVEAERQVSFATDDGLRFVHRDALFPLFEQAIGARNHADLTAALDAGGIVHSAYRTMAEAVEDARLVCDNPIFSAPDGNPSGARYPAAGAFATMPDLDRAAAAPAPRNGQHTEEVLVARLGLSSGEIARLIDAGIVGTGA
jgi:2-methylfumaryl-CoA isomerase